MKVLWAAHRRPEIEPAEFYRRWRAHGQLGLQVPQMYRLVQHHTLDEARGATPAPTHDGASIGWFESLQAMEEGSKTPEWDLGRQDGATLFDRSHGPCVAYADERVIVDGDAAPGMVKLIVAVARRDGLTVQAFQDAWSQTVGALASELPGLRRYVQNHGVAEAYDAAGGRIGMSHDGWSELWFEDLSALQEAMASEQGRRLRAAAEVLVDLERTGIIVAPELLF